MTNTALSTADDDLNALLAGLGLAEVCEVLPAHEETFGELELEAAVQSAESQEVVNAHYDAEPDPVADAIAPVDPMSDPSVLLSDIGAGSGDAPVAAAAPKKAKAPKAPKEPKEKKEPVVRKHYASISERVKDKLAGELDEYLVLELNDIDLDESALKAKQAELMEKFAASGVKVQKRSSFLMEFAAGKSATLNKIATTALTLLNTDGKITTGEKGSLFLELSKEYKKSSANTMGNNTLLALRLLKMVTKTADGYVANPQSLYLLKVMPMLGLA